MKNLPLNMLRAYGAVYETGGVRSAARRLGVTHSSVSKFLNELEDWLGVRLIERQATNRITGFTREGDVLGRSVINSLSDIQQVVTAISESRRQNAVVIEMTPSFATRWFFPKLGAFELAFPHIELSIIVEQRVRKPHEQEADISIRLGTGPWDGLECRPLMDDALYPVMREDYWKKHVKGKTPDLTVLRDMRLFHDRNPSASWGVWAAHMQVEGLSLMQGPRYSSLDLSLRGAEQGLGVALARHQFVAESLASGALIAPFENAVMPLPESIWIVRAGHGQPSAAAQLVLGWLIQQAETNPVTL